MGKVLIALMSIAFYNSNACLEEVSLAADHNIRIIPLRMDDNLPKKVDQWPQARHSDMEAKAMKAQEQLGKNSIPPRGSFFDVLSYQTNINVLLAEIRKELDV